MSSALAVPDDCELAAEGVCRLVGGVLWVYAAVPLEMGLIMSAYHSYRQNVCPFLSALSTFGEDGLDLFNSFRQIAVAKSISRQLLKQSEESTDLLLFVGYPKPRSIQSLDGLAGAQRFQRKL